ncbi:MAG TPA: 2Fe-2S iron-sulfur cluster-binding protein [Methylomirabilota bacterium]|jgi:sarcosine oxidase subunit alpha|nr:2Fe-2S iron-sulfur cluster-binding protein [Methylomirabilota bacterium]
MTTPRLPPHPAQRADPTRPLTFTFAGRPVPAFTGDTVGSALHAAGVRILSRSFKYHRPRGLLCCAGRCPNCLVNVDGVPNVRACTEPVRDGMRVRSQHAWPSVERDVFAVFDRFHRLLPVGFYYKTFIHPRRLWPTYEAVLRRLAGLGELAGFDEPPGDYEREHAFADIAVVGGGAAGMAAALEAARAGGGVVLIEAEPVLGGALRLRTRPLADGARGRAGWEVAAELAAEVAAEPRIRVLSGATAFGLYEDNLLGILDDRRFVKLRARQVVVATGGVEHPLVFENNDLPGVMLGSGAQRLMALYGVRPGTGAVVAAGDDRGLEVALDLAAGGVSLAAVLDVRVQTPESPVAAALRTAGLRILNGRTVLAALGRGGRVRAAVVGGAGRDAGASELACDLVCVTTGFEPAAGLLGQAGSRLGPDAATGRLVPTTLAPGVLAAGEVAGVAGLAAVLASGRLAGAQAALALAGGRLAARVAELTEALALAARPPAPRATLASAPRAGAKKFVCLCEDVTETDLRRAVAEGFDHIETLKRYTTATMGPCQGKMCHRPTIDLCAALTGRTVGETGTMTARPPAVPVPLGALAARLHEPVRYTPMHGQHVALGATAMDMGAWKRPLVYSSVEEECRAVHEAVGLIDVSTLGKLEVAGRDAAAFLDWLHPNRFSDLKPGRVRYRILCDDAGIILDDGTVARLGDERFLVTTTTGGVEAIEQWFTWWLAGTGRCAHVVNVTGALGAVNVAGPRARELLAPLTDVDLAPAAFPYLGAREGRVAGVPGLWLRIGFVGELGYEIHFPADYGPYLWDALLEAGRPLGIRPFGVEAQRVLRLEKQHLIVTQDTDALTNPFDADLEWIVKLDKADFVGRDALRGARARGSRQRLVGFTLAGDGPLPGEGAAVVTDGRPIGRVTSAKWSPHLGRVIGMAWLPAELARDGASFDVRVDGTTRPATVVTRPFYDPAGARLRM